MQVKLINLIIQKKKKDVEKIMLSEIKMSEIFQEILR